MVDKSEIQKQAKSIMDNFVNAMGDIEVENDFVLNRDQCLREEGKGKPVDEDFRQRFLRNAPRTSGDAILANKGEWTQ